MFHSILHSFNQIVIIKTENVIIIINIECSICFNSFRFNRQCSFTFFFPDTFRVFRSWIRLIWMLRIHFGRSDGWKWKQRIKFNTHDINQRWCAGYFCFACRQRKKPALTNRQITIILAPINFLNSIVVDGWRDVIDRNQKRVLLFVSASVLTFRIFTSMKPHSHYFVIYCTSWQCILKIICQITNVQTYVWVWLRLRPHTMQAVPFIKYI